MNAPRAQPDDAWWASRDPSAESEIDEKRRRGLADAKAGRLTSATQVRDEIRKHYADLGHRPKP
jgi:hypothetical protein